MMNIFKVTIATEDRVDTMMIYGAAEAAGQAIAAAGCVNVACVEVVDMGTGELMLLMQCGTLTWVCEEWVPLLYSDPLELGAGE